MHEMEQLGFRVVEVLATTCNATCCFLLVLNALDFHRRFKKNEDIPTREGNPKFQMIGSEKIITQRL
jgi:hypothetical protein